MTSNRALFTGLLAGLLVLPAIAQDPKRAADEPNTHVVRLEHTGAAELSQILRQLVGEDSQASGIPRPTIVAHDATNSLLISVDEVRWRELERLIAVLDVPSAGQDPTEVQIDGDVVLLAFDEHRPMSVADLTKLAQRLTGKVYTFDARRVGARPIDMVGTMKVTRDRFESMFENLLAVHGMRVEPRGEGDTEVHEIVSLETEAASGPRFVPIDRVDPADRGVVLTLIDLHHLDARQAVADLQRFVSPDTAIGAIGAGRSVLIQGPPSRVAEVAQVLARADASARERTSTQVVNLAHVDAVTIVGVLNQLFASPQHMAQASYSSFRAVAVGQNTLVLVGHGDQVEASLEVIARLDVEGR